MLNRICLLGLWIFPYMTQSFLLPPVTSRPSISLFWSPEDWQQYPHDQIPLYPNVKELDQVKTEMRRYQPMVYAGEIRQLRQDLQKVHQGKAFILQAGPCVETFQDDVNELRRLFELVIQTSLILSFGLEKQVIRIGRIAGQFAKPRSSLYEDNIETTSILTYRGDIIHGYNLSQREPHPKRMQDAYFQSVMTLNSLRSFAKSGDLHLNQISSPNFYPQNMEYQEFMTLFRQCMSFVGNTGILQDIHEPKLYISHEALLLHYEEVLTKQEDKTKQWFNCGAHTLWLGERTRQSPGHQMYLQGIENPIGIKVSAKANLTELVQLIHRLNPRNEEGKIMLIVRMGADKIRQSFPPLIKYLKEKQVNVIYMCDPCHGNTESYKNQKTRHLCFIQDELLSFFYLCHEHQVVPGGIHLEISGSNVTECIGSSVSPQDLSIRYKSRVDPRLNAEQTINTAFFICSLIRRLQLGDDYPPTSV